MSTEKAFDANEHIRNAVAAIDAQIAALQSKRAQLSAIIGEKPAKPAKPAKRAAAKGRKKRQLSPDAIERIRAAQKKRWSEAKKNKK